MIAGDTLVGTSGENNSWSQPRDVVFKLSYPANGTGAIVTYVQIDVNQVSELKRFCLSVG